MKGAPDLARAETGRRGIVAVRPRPDEVPLSFAQRRLWFLSRLEGHGPNYNEAIRLRFRDGFDVDAARAAIRDIVTRHEILRTVFPERDGVPCQRVLPGEVASPPMIMATLPEDGLQGATAEALRWPFDLRVETPLRVHVLEFAPDNHVLLLVVHHVAIDSWSVHKVLLPELLAAYHARVRGEAPVFDPLPLQYADYALWQQDAFGREHEPDSVLAQQLAFWRRTLAGLPDQMALPVDRPRPAVPTFAGGVVRSLVEPVLHARLQRLAREHRTSLFATMSAALAALLSRHGAGDDIVFGTPASGRTLDLNAVVGCFANTIVLRLDTSGNPTFAVLLDRARDAAFAARKSADVPFERLVAELNPSRSLSRNPLFQVLLGFQTVPPKNMSRKADRAGMAIPTRAEDHARLDLSFEFTELRAPGGPPSGIRVSVYFSTDLFDRSTVERLMARLQALLESIAEDPSQPIEQIDLLSPGERRQILDEWLPPATSASPDALVLDLIARRCAESPEQVAVIGDDGETLTYGQLDDRASRLAHYLSARGVGPEDVAGVCVDDLIEATTAMLAVLKAGAVCLPLDSQDSAQHLAAAIGRAAPRVVLSTKAAAPALLPRAPVICTDDAEVLSALAGAPVAAPGAAAAGLSDRAALLVYAADDENRAKAVVVTHRGVLEALAAGTLQASDRVLLLGSAASDSFTIGCLRTLAAGATLIHISPSDTLSARLTLERMQATGATVVYASSRFVRTLLTCGAHWPPGARCVIAGQRRGGDVTAVARACGVGVAVPYSLAETPACLVSGSDSDPANRFALVGRPASGSRIYVLDRRLGPVPIGVPGDVYVAGASLARGYYGEPQRTAATFVADPHGAPGTRMCRTGDIGRWREDGSLEILGPAREVASGRNLALGESGLLACAGIADAAVMLSDEPSRPGQVIGYVVCDAERRVGDLQSSLKAALPADHLPDELVEVREIPLTRDGRVDAGMIRTLVVPNVAPPRARSPYEERLCAMFAEVLGVDDVPADADFFSLGGHSLLVTKLINRVRSKTGVELDVRTVFDTPTAAGLARFVAAGASA